MSDDPLNFTDEAENHTVIDFQARLRQKKDTDDIENQLLGLVKEDAEKKHSGSVHIYQREDGNVEVHAIVPPDTNLREFILECVPEDAFRN